MNPTNPPPHGDVIRTVSQLLPIIDDGDFNADLNRAQQDLIGDIANAALNAGGKAKGKIVITLDYELDGAMLDIKPELKVTRPKTRRGRSAFWLTQDNHLSRTNPRQHDMFRDVKASTAMRDAPAGIKDIRDTSA